MPYKAYYQLQSEPFSNAPMTRFYFSSPQHEQTLRKLRYALDNRKGLAVCTGSIGAGKTTLARRLLDSLPDGEFEAALLVIVHSEIPANWLLKRIALQLGVREPSPEKLTLLSQLYRRLLQIHERGKKAVVLIDEAQMLRSRDVMEELRGLLNLEIPDTKLITFVLFGLPDIDETLRIDEPLRQRVAVRSILRPLDGASCAAYIRHRLALAGAASPLFSNEALDEIYTCSGGVPRLVNTLCDNVLFEGSLLKRPLLDATLVREVARELNLFSAAPSMAPSFPAPAKEKETDRPAPAAKPKNQASPIELEAFDRLLKELDRY